MARHLRQRDRGRPRRGSLHARTHRACEAAWRSRAASSVIPVAAGAERSAASAAASRSWRRRSSKRAPQLLAGGARRHEQKRCRARRRVPARRRRSMSVGLKRGEIGDAQQPGAARRDHCADTAIGGRSAASRSAFARDSSISAPAAADDARRASSRSAASTASSRRLRGVERELAGAAKQRVNRGQLAGASSRDSTRASRGQARLTSGRRRHRRRPGERADIVEPRLRARERRDRRSDGALVCAQTIAARASTDRAPAALMRSCKVRVDGPDKRHHPRPDAGRRAARPVAGSDSRSRSSARTSPRAAYREAMSSVFSRRRAYDSVDLLLLGDGTERAGADRRGPRVRKQCRPLAPARAINRLQERHLFGGCRHSVAAVINCCTEFA